jgi:hypothetical protein
MHRNLTDKYYISASGGMNYLQIRRVCSVHMLSAIWTVWTILVDSSLEKEIELWYFDAVPKCTDAGDAPAGYQTKGNGCKSLILIPTFQHDK